MPEFNVAPEQLPDSKETSEAGDNNPGDAGKI